MYKSNFCSDCGSRIERARWHFWTSRRFCSDCAPRFRRAQFLLPVIAGVALFCIGLAIGRIARPAPPPLIVERGQLAAVTTPSTKSEERAADAESERGTASAVPLTSTWQYLNYKMAGVTAKFLRKPMWSYNSLKPIFGRKCRLQPISGIQYRSVFGLMQK